MKRIFVAIDISEEARRRTAEYIDQLRREFPHLRVGWQRPENLHITLRFLGDVGFSQLEVIKTAAQRVAKNNGPYQMTLCAAGVFPLRGDPRILWIGAEDEGRSATRLLSQIDGELSPLGFTVEKRRFHPHLTIARIREAGSSQRLASSHLANGVAPISFLVREITIYESKLLPAGSTYSVVAKYQLKIS